MDIYSIAMKPSQFQMMGECSDKENLHVFDGENNNEGPREIRIARSELNDSFEAEHPENRHPNTKIKQKFFKRNHSGFLSPLIKPPNSHVRFDEDGGPILNLRPRGSLYSTDSNEDFTDFHFKGRGKGKRKKNRRLETESTAPVFDFICSSPSPPPTPPPSQSAEQSDPSYSPRISKYWAQRYRLFSKYDEGIRLDEEAWYSVTPEKIAEDIAKKMSCHLVVDAFCGAGGNAIQFAMTCSRVIAIDIDYKKIEMARHNARVYGVEEKIDFIVGDFFNIAHLLTADAIFLSPPWGGPEYFSKNRYNLQKMGGHMDGFKVFDIAKSVSQNIAFFVPKNTDMRQLRDLSEKVGGKVYVEKNIMNQKTKVLTAYYGIFADKLFNLE